MKYTVYCNDEIDSSVKRKLYGIKDEKGNILLNAKYPIIRRGDNDTFICGSFIQDDLIDEPEYFKVIKGSLIKINIKCIISDIAGIAINRANEVIKGKAFENGYAEVHTLESKALIDLNGKQVVYLKYKEEPLVIKDITILCEGVKEVGLDVLEYADNSLFLKYGNLHALKEALKYNLKNMDITEDFNESEIFEFVKNKLDEFNELCDAKQKEHKTQKENEDKKRNYIINTVDKLFG